MHVGGGLRKSSHIEEGGRVSQGDSEEVHRLLGDDDDDWRKSEAGAETESQPVKTRRRFSIPDLKRDRSIACSRSAIVYSAKKALSSAQMGVFSGG